MIHRFTQNGYNIAIDVGSGAVHLLDNVSYDLLGCLNDKIDTECPDYIINSLLSAYDKKSILEAYNELYLMYKEGSLFSEDNYSEVAKKTNDDNTPIKAMCLHMAHDCNLRCIYCFAGTGDYGIKRGLMPLDTAKKAIDFIIDNSGNRKNIEVDFFGGEPLLNFDVIKQTVEYANNKAKEKNKIFRFTITTNGILLDDEKTDYINMNFSNVVLSLDGRKDVNDKIRITPNNKGSYESIVPKYKKLVSERKQNDYYIRATFTKYNLDFMKDVLHIADLGFSQISAEPVIAQANLPYSLNEEDLPVIFNEYEKLAKEIIQRKREGDCFNFFHFNIDLEQGPCVIKRLKGCGVGNEYVAITPEGDIYPCHQFVGIDVFKMGNVFSNDLNTDIKKHFSASTVYDKEDCLNCWAKFYCSGGCNANNYLFNKDILKPNKLSCEIQKKRIECAIMIKAAISEA